MPAITLLSGIQQESLNPGVGYTQYFNLTGPPVAAGGWYGSPVHFYDVSIQTSSFVGTVYLDASLASAPGPNDWFTLPLVEGPLVFPQDPHNPTGLNGGDTGTIRRTFSANVLWLRARIDRSYLTSNPSPTQQQINLWGSVVQILACY